jgi:hypothetical protein
MAHRVAGTEVFVAAKTGDIMEAIYQIWGQGK